MDYDSSEFVTDGDLNEFVTDGESSELVSTTMGNLGTLTVSSLSAPPTTSSNTYISGSMFTGTQPLSNNIYVGSSVFTTPAPAPKFTISLDASTCLTIPDSTPKYMFPHSVRNFHNGNEVINIWDWLIMISKLHFDQWKVVLGDYGIPNDLINLIQLYL